MRPNPSIAFAVVLLGALLQVRCASGPAPIVVRVTSNPSDSLAKLRCPNIPQFTEQQEQTPARFRIPADFVRCEVDVSKENWQPQLVPITRDQIRGGGQPQVASADRITLQPGATPFSLLGALIVRWFHNIGVAMNERVNAEISPEIRIHVELKSN